MAGTFTKSLQFFFGVRSFAELFQAQPTRQELIDRESQIGGKLFGPAPQGVHRQFFNLDEKTWVWYEEQTDAAGVVTSTTTRYEVHPNGIMKIQEGAPYYYIEGQELMNLTRAIQTYYDHVTREIYRRDPSTGQLLAA